MASCSNPPPRRGTPPFFCWAPHWPDGEKDWSTWWPERRRVFGFLRRWHTANIRWTKWFPPAIWFTISNWSPFNRNARRLIADRTHTHQVRTGIGVSLRQHLRPASADLPHKQEGCGVVPHRTERNAGQRGRGPVHATRAQAVGNHHLGKQADGTAHVENPQTFQEPPAAQPRGAERQLIVQQKIDRDGNQGARELGRLEAEIEGIAEQARQQK